MELLETSGALTSQRKVRLRICNSSTPGALMRFREAESVKAGLQEACDPSDLEPAHVTHRMATADIAEVRSVVIKRLLTIAVVMDSLFAGLAGFSLHRSRLQYEERAETTTQNLSQASAGRISDAVDKIDLTVLTVADEVERQLAGGAIDADSLNAFIARYRTRLPDLDGLRVVNAQGDNVYGTSVTPGARASVADRACFAQLRSDPKAGLVISEPVIGRVRRTWWTMSTG